MAMSENGTKYLKEKETGSVYRVGRLMYSKMRQMVDINNKFLGAVASASTREDISE